MQRKQWPVAEWKFYVAFSLFRGASIYAGVYNRWTMVSFQMLNKKYFVIGSERIRVISALL